jgi:hypothetical protein
MILLLSDASQEARSDPAPGNFWRRRKSGSVSGEIGNFGVADSMLHESGSRIITRREIPRRAAAKFKSAGALARNDKGSL